MKRRWKGMIAAAMTLATITATTFPAFASEFGSRYDANGFWSNTSNLTWKFFDGGSVTIGRGTVFSDIHPEITDPEFYLKEAMLYPGEENGTLNSSGYPKADYTKGTLPLLQEFVNSFDWIHSDELTRLEMVHARIANGRNGNDDQHSGKPFPSVSFKVLEGKIGNCNDYASEFQKLANYVGLECVQYDPFAMHTATLVKINGQWIVVDPFMKESLFDNSLTMPVDYDIEYNRVYNEMVESDWYKNQREEIDRVDELTKRREAGELTEEEYWRLVYPDLSEKKIQEITAWDGYVDGLGN